MKMHPVAQPIAQPIALPIALAIAPATGAIVLVLATLPAAHTGKAHAHGVAKLDVAMEGNRLTVALESPLHGLLGFERAPRTDAERKAAADVLARLRSGGTLFMADAAAQCTLSKAEVSAPVLAQANTAAGQAPAGEHGDLDASSDYSCAQPQQFGQNRW